MLRACLWGAAIAATVSLAASLALAADGKAACARDLAATETRLMKTLVKMQTVIKVTPDQKCAEFRQHADVMSKAREVFARCSGQEADRDVRQLQGALDNVNGVIAKSCATP